MTQARLTKTHLTAGIWHGELHGAGDRRPELTVTHLGDPVEGLQMDHDPEHAVWHVRIPIPANLISDGVQTFVVSDERGHRLASFALLSGDALAEDIRTEIGLLRAELDMLKRSFRRHCKETGDT